MRSLPALHAISGCDAVSAINGIGKAKWLATIQKKEEYVNSISQLGDRLSVTEDVLATTEKMVCHLYGMPGETNINEVRYKKFCKEKTPEPHQLPPTRDELTQHVKRASYQAFVWKRALESNPDIPSPVGHGWEVKIDQLNVVWMENQPAPESVLELVTCQCRKSHCTSSCQCRVLSMECTDICKCRGNCENIVYFTDESDDNEFEEDTESNND